MAIIIALRLIVIATIDKDTVTTNNPITLDIGTMVYLDGFQGNFVPSKITQGRAYDIARDRTRAL